ncbi:MAG TPA: hypothetical protein VN644_16530 [Pyrinomonadaceae bacterium]|jgi:hypothetical protein|nr:hypothetical protein [Pyrinomonadaceae bacterium]
MKRKFTSQTAVFAAFAAVALLSLTAGAGAFQGDKTFRMYDDCEPTSFNAVLGDGACVGNGHTTFDQFIQELAETQDAHKWRNQPIQAHLNIGRPTFIENRGGEVHTFTRVANFGGGLFDELNAISGNPAPAPECLNLGAIVFIPAGGTEQGPTAGTSDLPVGLTRFQCCIHPWMRTVIEVADHAAPPEQAKPGSAHAHH